MKLFQKSENMAHIHEQIDFVVNVFITYNNKVLLIHHRKLDLWLPVGGHMEVNETPDDALIREIKEEVGIDAQILNVSKIPLDGNIKRNLAIPIYSNVHNVGDHDHCCFFYVCKSSSNKVVSNDEIKNYRWFSKEELNEKIIPKDVRSIALLCFEFMEKKK